MRETTAFFFIIGACAASMAVAIYIMWPVIEDVLGLFRRWMRRGGGDERIVLYEDDVLPGVESCGLRPLDESGKFARAYLLAKRYGDGYALHVSEDGVVAAVEAVEGCLAFFAGVYDFWHFVETDGKSTDLAAKLVNELERGDGERQMTRIHGAGGETYLTSVGMPDNVLYPYTAHVVTAQQFLEYAKGKRGDGDEGRGNRGNG